MTTFQSKHYVPILKLKRAEKDALGLVVPSVQAYITPLFEVVERKADKAPNISRHLDTAFKGFSKAVAPFARYLLDCREIASDGPATAAEAFRRAAAIGTPFTPVTGLSRTSDVVAALEHRGNGVAIRLTKNELEEGRIPRELPAFLRGCGLVLDEVDLIIDLGPVDTMVQDGIARLTEAFLDDVPDLVRWRNLIVSGCAFPSSMGDVDRDSHNIVERAEWRAWRDGLYSNRSSLRRLPTFSDCAIQHPNGVEGFDPQIMQASAAIRYTTTDDWLLIKGKGTRNTPAKDQFPQLASQLVYGDLSSHYKGSGHCVACRLMSRATAGGKGLASPEAWRRLGTAHHITHAVQDLANLSWP